MQMIFCATCGENLCSWRGRARPRSARVPPVANQVLPLFGAEHAMEEVMRVGVRHAFD